MLEFSLPDIVKVSITNDHTRLKTYLKIIQTLIFTKSLFSIQYWDILNRIQEPYMISMVIFKY